MAEGTNIRKAETLRSPKELVGVGLYSIPDVVRLLSPKSSRASSQNIRRWVDGYNYRYRGSSGRRPPLWRPEVPKIDGLIGLGFRDLMELRFVTSFREAGLSLQAIRLALRRACEIIGHDHPFATERFRTDGENMFLELAVETEDPALIDLKRNQYAIHRMIEPSFKDIDFDQGVAARWWPLGQRAGVVLDPKRTFGMPIDSGSGVPTDTLYAALKTLGSEREVARWFEVEPRAVRAARKFGESFPV